MLAALPQDSRVALSHASGSSEAGRYAVAATDISPGDAVLVAAPYLFVPNPCEFCSGLYLTARAVPASEHHRSSATEADTPNASSQQRRTNTGGRGEGGRKAKKKDVSAPANPVSSDLSTTTTTAVMSDAGEASYLSSHGTWCSGCFCEIPPGSLVANYAAIKDLAIDMSAEQEAVQELLRRQQQQDDEDEEREAVVRDDPIEGQPAAASGGAGKKWKKPTRSAKMRSDSAVELRNRLYEAALAQRESILHEHRLKKQQRRQSQRREQGDVRAITDGWPAHGAASGLPASGFAICEGCGVVLFCSPRCWAEGHARHVSSGECGVLRWVYPLIMREYYYSAGASGTAHSSSSSGGGGKGKGNAGSRSTNGKGDKSDRNTAAAALVPVVMPGDEPLHWARSASEEKNIEAQCMLLVSLLMASCGRETSPLSAMPPQPLLSDSTGSSRGGGEDFGVASHWGLTQTKREEAAEEVRRQRAREAAVLRQELQQQQQRLAEEKDGELKTGARPVLAQSHVVPKEVLTMQDTRIRLGVAGEVQVMDADATRLGEDVSTATAAREGASRRILCRDAAADGEEAEKASVICITASLSDTDDDESPSMDVKPGSEKLLTETPLLARARGDAALLPVRIPRYADMAAMVTNLCVLSKERRGCYSRYYRRFVKVILPWLVSVVEYQHINARKQEDATGAEADDVFLFPPGCNGQRRILRHAQAMHHHHHQQQQQHRTEGPPSPSPPPTWESLLSEAYFTRVCAASQCNTFGVYTCTDRQIAFGAYPEASYFNHSCLPNLCRVMGKGGRAAVFYALRHIPADEPLTICYTDVEETSTAERRRNLLETYRFFCTCERCSGSVGARVGQVKGRERDGEEKAVEEGQSAATSKEAPASGRGSKGERKGCPVYLCDACPIRGYLRPLAPPGCISTEPPAVWDWTAVKERQCTMCGRRYPLSSAEGGHSA